MTDVIYVSHEEQVAEFKSGPRQLRGAVKRQERACEVPPSAACAKEGLPF